MAKRKTAIEVAQSTKGKVNPYYCLSLGDMDSLTDFSKDEWDLLYNFFCFGYAQGMKACKSEMKKGVKKS